MLFRFSYINSFICLDIFTTSNQEDIQLSWQQHQEKLKKQQLDLCSAALLKMLKFATRMNKRFLFFQIFNLNNMCIQLINIQSMIPCFICLCSRINAVKVHRLTILYGPYVNTLRRYVTSDRPTNRAQIGHSENFQVNFYTVLCRDGPLYHIYTIYTFSDKKVSTTIKNFGFIVKLPQSSWYLKLLGFNSSLNILSESTNDNVCLWTSK